MRQQFILVIDEGTTGTRALVIDLEGITRAFSYSEITQIYPEPGWVEHDPVEIWQKTRQMMAEALAKAELSGADIAAIGISNQRSTAVVWERATGRPIYNALVWQDRRGAEFITTIRAEWEPKTLPRAGTTLRPSSTAILLWWLMENVPGARARAERGELMFGTIESWLIYQLTGGKVHVMTASNASQCRAYDMIRDCWNDEWLGFLGVPMALFPAVCDDSGFIGFTDPALFGVEIPITAAIGDQHAALFGQGCHTPGSVKCTHGTGTFLDMNIGSELKVSPHGVNTMIAWRRKGVTTYAMEGYAAVTGSAIQWLRDGAGLIASAAETAALAESVADNGGVYFVPALAGLSAPYWDPFACGLIIGITRGTRRAHLVRATLEGIALATRDFIDTMSHDSGIPIRVIRVDGGASVNDFLLQFQSDIQSACVERTRNPEATSLGAAFLAGLEVGFWRSDEECIEKIQIDRVFRPQMEAAARDRIYRDWQEAVARSRSWLA